MISFFKKITQSQRKLYTHIILFFILGVFIICIAVLSYFAQEEKKLANKIYPNIYINNLSVGTKTKKEAASLISQKKKDISNMLFEIYYKNTPISTMSAQDIDIEWNGDTIIEKAYSIGRNKKTTVRIGEKINSLLGIDRHDFETTYIYNENKSKKYISSISAQYNREPKNALFKIENGRVVAFREDKKGKKINETRFFSDIKKIINKLEESSYKPHKEKIILSEDDIDADITLAQANDLGIEEFIAEGRSNYSGSIDSRIHNITLAASKFHGVIIPQGKELSFNEIVGDISINTGYKQAYIIKEGKTVLGDGGGVCQVSTTLFRAGLNAGLPITERHAHAYRVGYYENDSQPGFDATIYSPRVDLKIKNDTPADILIQTEIEEEKNLLYFRFYGKNDGRDVHTSDAVISDTAPPPPDIHEEDPTLPRGQTKQIDFAAPGAKVHFTYKVTRDNKTLQDETFFSYYKPWAAVYLVGTKD